MIDVTHEPRWGRIAEGDGRGPLPRLGPRGRPRERRPRARLQRARQGGREREAPRRLRPAGGRSRLQHDRHVRAAPAQPLPAAVQGRGRRRRRHRDVLVQRDQRRAGLRNPVHRDDILKGEWGFDGFVESDYTAVDELRACPPHPRHGPCGHGVAADGPDAGALALNAGVDMEMVSTNIRDYGAAAAGPAARSRWRGSTTPCAGSCASSSAPASSSTRTSTWPRPRPQLRPDAVAAARAGAGRVDGAAEERRRARCRSTRPRRRRSSARWPRTSTTCSAPGAGRARTTTPSRCTTASRRRARARRTRQALHGRQRRAAGERRRRRRGSTAGFADAVATAKAADQVVPGARRDPRDER